MPSLPTRPAEIPATFNSPRLLIRAPREDDAPLLYNAIIESLDALRPWMHWAQHPPRLETTQANLQRAIAAYRAGDDLRLHLFDRADNTFIGSSGLHNIDWSVPRFEIGYWVRTSRTKRGLATEAVRAIAEFAFRELHARRIEIRTSTRNHPSRLVAERAGFQLEAVLRHHQRHPDGSLRDTVIFSRITPDPLRRARYCVP